MTRRVEVGTDAGPEDLVAVELPEDQRELLIQGLAQWGGPARPTDAGVRAIGFADRDALLREGAQIRAALAAREPLTAADWRRALAAAELVFASDVHGAGVDWEAVTGWTDAETIHVLRKVQRTLAAALASVGPAA
jgi:hypothetical protein